MFSLFSVLAILPFSVHSYALDELTIDDQNITTVFHEILKIRRFAGELVEIEGTCRIIKTDRNLPKMTGKCGNYGECKVRLNIDGYQWNEDIPHKTCRLKGPKSNCFVPAVVTKNVRCLLDEQRFIKQGNNLIVCLDSTEPGINMERIVTQHDYDPQIVDTSHCNVWKRIRKTRW